MGYETFRYHVPRSKKQSVDTNHASDVVKQATPVQRYEVFFSSKNEGIPYSPTENAEQEAICFFFAHIQPRMTGYWTEDLPAIYSSKNSGSILKKAALSVAYNYTSLSPHRAHYKRLAVSEYLGALRLINKVICNPAMAFDDVFIMALLCLAMWEVSGLDIGSQTVSTHYSCSTEPR